MYHLCLVHKAQGPKGKREARLPPTLSSGPLVPSPWHSVLWN